MSRRLVLGRARNPARPARAGRGAEKRNRIVAIGIGVAAVMLMGFLYYVLRPPPPQNVALAFSDPGQVLVGEPFSLAISYANHSPNVLEGVKLSIALPDGM